MIYQSTSALMSALMIAASVSVPITVHATGSDRFTTSPDPDELNKVITYDVVIGNDQLTTPPDSDDADEAITYHTVINHKQIITPLDPDASHGSSPGDAYFVRCDRETTTQGEADDVITYQVINDKQTTTQPDPNNAYDVIKYDVDSGIQIEDPVLTSDVFEERLEHGQLGGSLYGTLFGMGEVTPVDDPAQWPARANVVVGSPYGGACSGTLIDSRHVLTAGHCFFSQDFGWSEEEHLVSPGTLGYGFAKVISVTAFKGWTEHGWHDHDIAIATLDRPIGALTGYYGYGTGSCWDLTHGDFETYSFPQLGPFSGEMVYTDGDADWCPTAYKVQVNIDGWKGMSGSSIADKNGHYARAVAVTKYDLLPEGVRYARINNNKFDVLYDVIHTERPNTPDLIPVGLRVGEESLFGETLTPALGETLDVSGIYIHNYSDADFSGNVDVHIKLSGNDNISGDDLTLWSYQANLDIADMGIAAVPAANIVIPDTVNAGLYYVGVWIDVNDANTSNNDGSDELFNELVPLTIESAYVDLEVDSIEVETGTFADFQKPDVTFQVANVGELDCGEWWGDFYLTPQPFFGAGDNAILVGTGSATHLDSGDVFMDTDWISLKDVPAGTYWVHLIVGSDAEEAILSNNSATSIESITVNGISDFQGPPPNLRLDYVALVSGSYDRTDELPITFSVTNTSSGAGWWHGHFFAVNAQGDVVHLASGSAPSLAGGSTFASTEHLPLDGLAAGTWWVAMSVETDGEYTTADNTGSTPTNFSIEFGLTTE